MVECPAPPPVEARADFKIEDPQAMVKTEVETGDSVPPHRSHDPQNNLKRSDPFMFGSRYLEAGDNVYEFNAWDHVETDDAYKEYAEKQYDMQRQSPVSDFDKIFHPHLTTPIFNAFFLKQITGAQVANVGSARFNGNPAKWWNQFYKNNNANFFKNRKWLQQEFPVLAEIVKEDAGSKVLLEIGAGAGNTAFPVLANNSNPKLKVHACDFSKTAVEVMRNHESYDTHFMQADVWDAAGDNLPPGLEENSVDVAVMVFIFSALSPSEWLQAVRNVYKVLKPGGLVCFRDYGRGDLAQVRFRKGRYLEENFYIRGDGTRVYFFEQEELVDIWSGSKFERDGVEGEVPRFGIESIGVDRRLLVNRKEEKKMYRCWMQGRFRKK